MSIRSKGVGDINLNYNNASTGGLFFYGGGTDTTFSVNNLGRVRIGTVSSATAKLAIKNGLLANATEWYNSRGTQIAKLDSVGGLTVTSLSGSTIPTIIGIACSDETTALTASTSVAKITFRVPYAMTVTAVRASVTTAPTGATILVDIHESGTTILSTKIMIDAGELTSTTATTGYVLSDTALADDAEITVFADQVGSSVAGAGLKIWIIGTRVAP
jgi:hypothetical protein